ncbi:conserved hypothetical protein [Sporisorium reilianum SRZ2]|uniref:Uncharacterized protein n=1 Tax=Sporisorium reilianum (strain SRZ2) TaxID=999809 RepID=E6ZJY6_SPORE|nr:conserved hypothetical protein [Sporisorium reilianum SRZ2]
MFSQWRSKRHLPMDSSPSVFPKSSSQPTTPVDAEFPRNDTARSTQHHQQQPSSLSSRPTGVKALSKVAIGKGAKFRPGTRDGSGGAPSPMSFAAGPRSTSRGGNSLEFGGGVVPDDSSSHSDADQSDSVAASPLLPLYWANTSTSTNDNRQTASLVSSTVASSSSPSKRPERSAERNRLQSIDTLGSLDDFRSMIAFSSPTNLLDESPSLTTSTAMSTPDVAAAITSNRDKPLPIPDAHDAQPPPTTPSLTKATPEAPFSSSVVTTSSTSKSVWPAPSTVSAKTAPSTVAANDAVGPASLPKGAKRRSTASSLPESISQPGSSQPPSEEFQSPGRKVSPARRVSTTEAMRRLEESVQRGADNTAAYGLGISSTAEESQATSAYRSRARDLHRSNSLSSRRHAKSSSEVSARSSVDSWGRTSFGRDTQRMMIDSDLLDDAKKPASSASSNTRRTYVSDSDHSTTTAETSTDMNESDHLSTIKEHTESPGSALQRRISAESRLSRSQNADLSDACTSRTSASSARSDAFRTTSPEIHFVRAKSRLSQLAEAREVGEGNGKRFSTAPSQSVVNGIGSPTFELPPSRPSQSSARTELLPPVDLDAPAPTEHTRRPSNASWTYSRNPTLGLSLLSGPRRGSVDHVSTAAATPRTATETHTAPLPSLPFPPSTPSSLSRATFPRSTAHASEPSTPNLTYEALLAKTVGKQRKGRPAALALNLTTINSALSVNSLANKGLASPGKLRAPPPSAPPTDPLPPIPDTPSLVPKSPGPRPPAGSLTSAVGDDKVDPPRTPRISNASRAFSPANGEPRALQVRSPGPAPDAAVKLVDALGGERASSKFGNAKQDEYGAQAKTGSKDAVPVRGLMVLPKPDDGSSSPATVVSVEGSSDSAMTVAIAQTATRAARKPVRLSISKKDGDVQEAIKTAASTVVATEHADGQIVSPATTSRSSKDKSKSKTNTAKAETETPRSPTALDQIISFDLTPQRQPSQQQQQQQQLPQSRRTTANDKISGPPPSAWSNRSNPLVSHRNTPSDSKASSDAGDEPQEEMRGGAESVASCHSTLSSISNRRVEVMHDKEALLGALSESSRKEILKRTEGRFAGAFAEVAQAFRQLQADKLLLEHIVREKTPLSGVGANNEMLSGYLSSTNTKLEQSKAEIRKLLDLLEQQREVMDQMMATHQLEKETYEEDLERLYTSLDETQAEAEHHQAQVVKLNEELARAHAATVQANAEAMHARSTLAEEGRKREKVVLLLRQAKERLREVETENLVSCGAAQQSEGRALESEIERLSTDGHSSMTVSESEVMKLRRLLEERDQEIASLRLSHADAVMQQEQQDESSPITGSPALGDESNVSTPSTASTAVMEATAPTSELARLRAQILEQKEREKQIRSAYVYVREELRKVNSERRRSSISSIHSLTAPATAVTSAAVAPGHSTAAVASRAVSPWASTINARLNGRYLDASRPPMSAGLESDGEGGQQQVKLKRLSLPVVARASGIVVASPGGVAAPSAYRPPST